MTGLVGQFFLGNSTLPSEEIILNQVVSPNTLFTKNKEVIFEDFIIFNT